MLNRSFGTVKFMFMKLKSTLMCLALLAGWNVYGQLATVDLRNNNDPASLQAAIENLTEDTHILLKPGVQYTLDAPVLTHALILESEGGKAILEIKSGFDLAAVEEGGTEPDVSFLKFVNLELKGNNPSGDYVANWSKPGNLNEFVFDNCLVHSFRGVMRMKDAAPIRIGKAGLQNTVVHTVGGYGVFNQDNTNEATVLDEVVFFESTVANTERLVVSRNTVGSVLISDVTFYNAPRYGRAFIDMANADAVIEGGVHIENVILTTGLDGNPNNGVRAGSATEVSIINSYASNDFDWNSLQWRVEDVAPFVVYDAAAAALFAKVEEFDFTIVAGDFVGKDNAGDPRFYSEGTPVGLVSVVHSEIPSYWVVGNRLQFERSFDQIELYGLTGQLLHRATSASELAVVRKGIYLVRITDATMGSRILKVVF